MTLVVVVVASEALAVPGDITRIAGTGFEPGAGCPGDGGPALVVPNAGGETITADADGNVYVTNGSCARVRRVDAGTGIIATVAGFGIGASCSPDGGLATDTPLSWPNGVAVDGDGNVYFADIQDNRVRRVDAASGVITTIAGTSTCEAGYSGDGGPGTLAKMQRPTGVAIDSAGNLYIADKGNNRVRKVDAASGIITTFAGTGVEGFSGDGGPATSAKLYSPSDLALDSAGNLYIADLVNSRVRKVDAASGIITTVAGSGKVGFPTVGIPATDSMFNTLGAVAVDAEDTLFISQSSNGPGIYKVDAFTGILTAVPGAEGAIAFSLGADGLSNLYFADAGTIHKVEGPYTGGVGRLFGADRFATAAVISASEFDPGVPVVFIGTGRDFPDALAGGPVAGINGAPILLAGSIPGATAGELTRLRPQKIVILGGTGVISEADALRLASFTSGPVQRLAGKDRFATAAAVSASEFPPGVPVAYVATGLDFPDALAGGPVAALNGGPILLVRSDTVPDPTATELNRLQPQRIVILGGTGVVSPEVEVQLDAFTSGPVERLAGADRFATAAAISASYFSPNVEVVYIATGSNFPDALAGVPVATVNEAPILLVGATTVPAPTAAELTRLKPTRIVVLGGPRVVSTAVLTQLAAYTG